MGKYTPRRPEYIAEKFYGLDSIPMLCELACTEEFVLTSYKHGRQTVEIAGLTLHHQELLVRAPDKTLSIMSVTQLRQKFEAME